MPLTAAGGACLSASLGQHLKACDVAALGCRNDSGLAVLAGLPEQVLTPHTATLQAQGQRAVMFNGRRCSQMWLQLPAASKLS